MFDNVRFEGTINLGAICVALIQLISAYTVLVRVRAMMEEKNIKLTLFKRRKEKQQEPAKPVEPEPANNGPCCDPGPPGEPGLPGEPSYPHSPKVP